MAFIKHALSRKPTVALHLSLFKIFREDIAIAKALFIVLSTHLEFISIDVDALISYCKMFESA